MLGPALRCLGAGGPSPLHTQAPAGGRGLQQRQGAWDWGSQGMEESAKETQPQEAAGARLFLGPFMNSGSKPPRDAPLINQIHPQSTNC